MKFPANIVVPLLLRWRPSLYRWDSRMFLWKITFFSSHFNISIYFFMTSFAFFLSVRTWGRRYKYSYSQDDELWSNLWFVWALYQGRFHFIWRIIRPSMNDVVELFFRFGIKRNVFAKGKNRTFIFLLLQSFVSLKPAITESPVINVVHLLHSSDCLCGSISDGFDHDALFLASSVCVCANTGWGITISLFSSVAIPCSSLSVLPSDSVFLFKLIFFFKLFFFFCVITFSCWAIYAEVSDVMFLGRYVLLYKITIFFWWEVRDQVFGSFFWTFIPLVVTSNY